MIERCFHQTDNCELFLANGGLARAATNEGNPYEAKSLPAMTESAASEPIVFVIDDDTSVRAAVKDLLESVGLKVFLFGSAAEFLESTIPDASCCMVLDVRMPEMSGLKLQEELLKAEVQVPIVFISGHADIAMAVRAMKAGAVDFLAKPFSTQELLDAVFAALGRDRARRTQEESLSALRERFGSLSVREKEVLSHVAAGRLNKQIAGDLGVSEVMVKVHRANGMRKMHAKSVAELVRMTDLLRASHSVT